MLTKNVVRQPKALVEIQITVPWSDLEGKWSEVANRVSQGVDIPGFRKGTAPLNLVEEKFISQIQQDFLKEVMPQKLMEALQGDNIIPIDYPKYQLTSFTKGSDLKFSAQVTQRPQVSVGNYKGIKVTRPQLKVVGDDQVNKIVDDLFRRWKLRQPVGGATVNTQGTAQSGSGSMSFSANPTASSETPDDSFAKAVGASDLTDLKGKIRTDLENEAKYNNELDYEEAILQEVEKMTSVDAPEVLVQDELNRMLVSLQRRVTDTGLLFDDYLKGQNKTLDGLRSEWRVQAEKNVRMELGLSEIAKAEGVDISDQELQAEIDKIHDQRIKAQFQAQEPRLHLRHALRQTKTLNLLKTLVS